MAKKARIAAPAQNQPTAAVVLALIESLPAAELTKLFELLAGHPKNEPVSELLRLLLEALRMFDKLWSSTEKVWGGSENASSIRQQLGEENAEKLFGELRQKVGRLQAKRGMTAYNRETLDLFCVLQKKHGGQRGGQMEALKELVTLPSEQGKDYVLAYQASCRNHPHGDGDMEPVRQHVKRLRSTDRKRRL